jgi:type I restriction enzyme S subunit
MNTTFPKIPVSELVASGEVELKTGPFGTQLKASDYVENGIPVINVRNIGFGTIRPDKLEYITDATRDRLSTHVLRSDDIVFGRKGAVERHVFVRRDQDGWFQGSDCLRLRLNSPRIDPRFASYYFLTEEHQQWMKNQCSHAATMASLNQQILERIELPVPPLPTQRKIAGILSAYDDLIENNLRRIKILEEMAQSLYREWFVHFRFPGHENVKFVDSALGMIPEGWKVKPISSFGKVVTGKTPSKANADFYGVDVPFVKTPDMHGNMFIIEVNEKLSTAGADSQAKKTLPIGSICVSCIGTIGVVSITTKPCQTNQQINSIVLTDEKNMEFLFFSLRDSKQALENLGSNGATMGNVNKNKFESLEIISPHSNLIDLYHKYVMQIFYKILALTQSNRNLCLTRDLVLTHLLQF